MPKTRFSLNTETLAAFDRVGLRLPGLRQTRRLASGSRIEAPTSVISTVAPGAFLDVGAFCNLSGGTINNVRFGRYCSVASGVVIGPHEHPTDWLTTSRIAYYPEVNGWDELVAGPSLDKVHALHRPFPDSCPVTEVGPDVWIGQGAFIKAGVTIGAGAIIGARATVLRDVPLMRSSSEPRAGCCGCASPRRRSRGCSPSNGGSIRSTICSRRRWTRSTPRSTRSRSLSPPSR